MPKAAMARAIGIMQSASKSGVSISPGEIEWSEPARSEDHVFRISRFLVSNAQFDAFARSPTGYSDDSNWTEAGLKWRLDKTGPSLVETYPFFLANHPKVLVRWYEAMAFCVWLSRILAADIRLPVESEWEIAAAGTVPGAYVYGSAPDASAANVKESGIGATSAVGVFQRDLSAIGLYDIAGNAREWCLNSYLLPSESPSNVAGALVGQTDFRAIRGGCFDMDMTFSSRLDTRGSRSPTDATPNIGFRLLRVEREPLEVE